MRQHIIVIGGGLAGLTAAYELDKAGFRVTIIEKDTTAGGRARSDVLDGFRIDAGAGFITNHHTNTLALLSRLGLTPRLVALSNEGKVLRGSALMKFGLNMRLSLRSYLQLGGTAAMVAKYWRTLDIHKFETLTFLDTCSVEEYCRQHLTSELLEYVVQPALASTFFWTPGRTSQAMLFILLKVWVNMHRLTLRCGIGQLLDTLTRSLNVVCATEVKRVRAERDGSYTVTTVAKDGQGSMAADGIVCAVEAPHAAQIIENLTLAERTFLNSVQYAPALVGAVATRGRPMRESQSIFVPRSVTQLKYLGNVTSLATKNNQQVPRGCDVLKMYVRPEIVRSVWGEADERVLALLINDLADPFGPQIRLSNEVFRRVYRWEYAVPEFGVGYFKALAAFLREERGPSSLVFAGDYLCGPWIEGAVTSGMTAACSLTRYFGQH